MANRPTSIRGRIRPGDFDSAADLDNCRVRQVFADAPFHQNSGASDADLTHLTNCKLQTTSCAALELALRASPARLLFVSGLRFPDRP